MSDTLSLVLFSGTDDRLQAAAILAAGASALGRPVDVLLQSWAVEAFRSDRPTGRLQLAPEAGEVGERARDRADGKLAWLDTFRQAKELGEVTIQACSNSLDFLEIDATQLDPIVDGCAGVATFFMKAEDGQILFI